MVDIPSVEMEFVHVIWRPMCFNHLGCLSPLLWERFQIALIRVEEIEFFVNRRFPVCYPRFADELGIVRRYVDECEP